MMVPCNTNQNIERSLEPRFQFLAWQLFLKEVFNRVVDLSKSQLPESREGFNWLIVVPKGLTLEEIYRKCRRSFMITTYRIDEYDYLKSIDSVRTAEKTYALWVRNLVEAEEHLNMSADDCGEEGVPGMTLEERLLLELFFQWKTGEHLDLEFSTLCSGSQTAFGSIPYVSLSSDAYKEGVVSIYDMLQSQRHPLVGVREVTL